MEQISPLINQLKGYVPNQERLNAAVSQSPVGWHIEHSLLVIDIAISGMLKSNPEDYTWKFSFWKWATFTIGKFPRGKAKAPKAALPKEHIDTTSLNSHLQQTLDRLNQLEGLHPNQYLNHPFFGKLNLKNSKRMLELHTKHHIKIIEDILR